MKRASLVAAALSLLACAKPTPPARSMPAKSVSGRLPPAVIQKIVRLHFDRFRACYEAGLGRDSNLKGRISIRFVIGRDGAVTNVGNGGSDLPDKAVVSCVTRGFMGLTFPQPEGGIVTVVYPIMFSPEERPLPNAAPPGFFAGCTYDEYVDTDGKPLLLQCASGRFKIATLKRSVDENEASRQLDYFERWLNRQGRGQRKSLELAGKSCWASVVEGGKDWTTMVVVPMGPKETRLLYCGPKDGQASSPWCDKALAIMAKDGAPKDLLATP